MSSGFRNPFMVSSVARYGFAIVCAILGVGARYVLSPALGTTGVPFLLAYPAVAAAAWVGGFWPAVLCSACSALASFYLFFDPPATFQPLSFPETASVIVFLGATLLIALLGERSRRALSELSIELKSRLNREEDLRQADERLREAEEDSRRLAAIVMSSDDAILSMDLEGTITSWNAAAERTFGYTGEEIVGKSIYLLVPPQLHEEERQMLFAIAQGQRVEHLETVRMRNDGRFLQVSLTVSPIRDREGRVIGASKISRDITERKRSEQALRKTEMEAAKGRLAATIAHEINNPLEAITNIGYLVARAPELGPESKQLIATLNSEVSRVSDITRQALAFYRESGDASAVSVAAVIDSVLDLFRRRMAQKRITLSVRHGEKIPRVMVKPGELRQVIANLLANALDAVADGGHIMIRTRSTAAQVRITVSDNGVGIPKERRERMFQPFETTKGDRGTGLGLWVSKGLVEKYGGQILYRSSQLPAHRGTSFAVILPRVVMESVGAA